jgi:CHAT domain-containing protein
VLITPKGKPIHKRILAAKREVLLETVKDFRKNIVNHTIKGSKDYFPAARQLHQWIIAPLEADLETNNIDSLIFCMGVGLRTIPLAAFHDGQKFLIEKYSIGRIPAFKLTDTRYADIKNHQFWQWVRQNLRNKNHYLPCQWSYLLLHKSCDGVNPFSTKNLL